MKALAPALAFALAACGPMPPQGQDLTPSQMESVISIGNDLSEARRQQLGAAFVGREIVFRVPWYEYAWVDPDPDPGKPCNLHQVMSSSGGMAVKVGVGTAERGNMTPVARPGDTARITGMRITKLATAFYAKKPDGRRVFVIVGMPRGRTIIGTKQGDCTHGPTISDANLSVAWLENALAVAVGELVAPAVARAEVALPAAEKGLELTPPPLAAAAPSRSKPSVALIEAGAEPTRVRRGEVVRLGMAFRVEAGGAAEVRIEESYDLTFEGKRLPNFPVQRARPRGAGEHRSEYSQQIPQAAAPGTYRFRAEVCLDGACSSRVSSFEIGAR